VASGASNLAPSNPALATRVKDDAAKLFVQGQGAVPLSLLTTSGSGLDPHLPPAGVDYQVARVAQARGVSVEALKGLVAQHTETSLFGPPVVNVLALNMAMAGAAR
jgi:K+-transporting ATPase ATPase C chain